MKPRRIKNVTPPPRVRLQVEQLESRELLTASPLSGELTRLLVQYQGDAAPKAILVPEAALEESLAKLRQNPNVRFAELDQTVSTSAIPNDPSFSSLWGLHNTGQSNGTADADIDAVEAWDIYTGTSRTVVAILDTGIDYRHADLFRNIWINTGEIPADIRSKLIDTDGDQLISFWDLNDSRNQGAGKITDLNANGRIDGGDLLYTRSRGGWADGIDTDGEGYVDDLIGWDFLNNDNNPLDDNNHGTHVAGTIGAQANNGIGVTGINWKVSMMALKFLGSTGSGSLGGAVEALRYAVAHGAKISNNSWGSSGYSQALYDAIDQAREAGHIFVTSAGNGGSDAVGDNIEVTPNYPAAFNLANIVSVTATSRNDKLGRFANFGAVSVDLAAPGLSVVSTVLRDRYSSFNGTSMAAPHVTGVLALLQGKNPNWRYYQLIDQILATTDQLTVLQGKTVTGGRLNAFRALTEPLRDVEGAQVLSASPNASGSEPVSSVRIRFSEAIRGNTFTLADIRSFTGPQGALSVTRIEAVPGTEDQVFDLLFDVQRTPGTYTLVLGPDIRDMSGNMMDQDRDGLRGESVHDRYTARFVINPVYTFTNSTSQAIRDFSVTVSTITIDRDFRLADVNVKLDILHTFDNDLLIKLRGPDGTEIALSNRRGGRDNNFTGTLFDDEARLAIREGVAPFSGSFRPDTPLSVLDGKNARGIWQLIVEDKAAADTGKLLGWSLILEEEIGGGTNSLDLLADEAESLPTVSAATTVAPQTFVRETTVLSGQSPRSSGISGRSTAEAALLDLAHASPGVGHTESATTERSQMPLSREGESVGLSQSVSILDRFFIESSGTSRNRLSFLDFDLSPSLWSMGNECWR